MAGGVQFLIFLAIHIQKEHLIEDLLNFLIVLFTRVLLKSTFLKQHQTDLEQYSLAPISTSTAKRSTHQPLDSIISFKAENLLILIPGQDFIFSSYGHVSSIRITLLKLFERIAMSGLG